MSEMRLTGMVDLPLSEVQKLRTDGLINPEGVSGSDASTKTLKLDFDEAKKDITVLQLSMAEIVDLLVKMDFENKLAVAEMAEALVGGAK